MVATLRARPEACVLGERPLTLVPRKIPASAFRRCWGQIRSASANLLGPDYRGFYLPLDSVYRCNDTLILFTDEL